MGPQLNPYPRGSCHPLKIKSQALRLPGVPTGYLWEPPRRATRVQQGGGSALLTLCACRCSLASLLTIALHGKLEYYTSIMKELLVDLIDASAAKNPKLMLRRTESVVEKMLTNWMSICMYGCLRVRPPLCREAPPLQANLTSLRWWVGCLFNRTPLGRWGNRSLEKIWLASLLQEHIAFSGRERLMDLLVP